MLDLNDKIPLESRKNDVLAVGELLVDMISMEPHCTHKYHQYFGGASANLAMNVKRLGANSRIASAVGTDRLGDFLVKHLEQNDIDTDLIQRVAGATSLVLLNRSNGTPLPIFYRDADYQLSYTKALETELLASKIVHFSCWSISRMPARNTLEKVLRMARESNVLVGFDPNYHKQIWQSGEDGVSYVKSIIGQTDIIKPSEDDAARLFGEDTPHNQIEKFLARGTKLVILTMGKDGLILSNGTETLEIPTFAKEVVGTTTGAGDAFWAGFYAAIINGCPIKRAVLFGSAASAYKLKHVGAVVNLPHLSELGKLYNL